MLSKLTAHGIDQTALYLAINTLFMLGLSILTVIHRRKYKVSFWGGGIKEMDRASRAHSNNAEYVPFAILLMVASEMMGAENWFLHTMGILLTLARVSHALGLYKTIMLARQFGTLGTWIVLASGSVYCLVKTLS